MEGLFQNPSTWPRIILTYFGLLCFVLISETFQAPSNGLYSDKDNVLILNERNFAASVYDKNNAFIIEFYDSSCASCKKFAPKWIQFAGDIKLWRYVVVPAAIDCSTSKKFCENFDLKTYPTVKLFWTHLQKGDLGDTVPYKCLDCVKNEVINFLIRKAQETSKPSDWPMLEPVKGTTLHDIEENADLIPNDDYFIVLDKAGMNTGIEVILDYSWTFYSILRMDDTSAKQVKDLPPIKTYPALVVKRPDNPIQIIYATSENEARKEFRSYIARVKGIDL